MTGGGRYPETRAIMREVERRGGLVEVDGRQMVDAEILKAIMREFAEHLADELATSGAPAEADRVVREFIARIEAAFPSMLH